MTRRAVESIGSGGGGEQAWGDEAVRIAPYDPAWPGRFAEERELLASVIGRWAVGGIHHVGSTAVPGLAAKPVIDTNAKQAFIAGALADSAAS